MSMRTLLVQLLLVPTILFQQKLLKNVYKHRLKGSISKFVALSSTIVDCYFTLEKKTRRKVMNQSNEENQARVTVKQKDKNNR